MIRKTLVLVLILLISGAAVYSFVSLGFFDKLGMVFQESGQMQRHGQAGQHARMGWRGSGRGGGHGAISLWDGLLQMGAYFAVFAFVVMLTYYGEQLLKKHPVSNKECTPFQRDYCNAG